MTLSADRDIDRSGIGGASRLSGWFDPHDPVHETAVRIDRGDPSTVLVRGDWISARISAADGDAFATDDAVLLLTGRPLLDGRPVAAAGTCYPASSGSRRNGASWRSIFRWSSAIDATARCRP